MQQLEKFQEGLQTDLNAIRNFCVANKLTIAVAESVSAGAIQLLLSTAQDATLFFQGGITAYNLGQKSRHLLVEPIYAENCNCVDNAVSIEMAKGVCNLFSSQIGIGITGYATKVPALGIKRLYANIAIVKNGTVIHESNYEPETEMISAQMDYAAFTINKLASVLR